MSATWIVDGYNVLHRGWPEFLRAGALEDARRLLVERLEQFRRRDEPGARVLLVFDGRGDMAGSGHEGRGGVRVVFARAPRSADEEVLELARRHEGRGDVVVVTSDFRDIGGRVSGLRVRSLSAEAFARRVEGQAASADTRNGRSRGTAPGKPGRTSPRETEDWLRAFGLHPEDDTP